MRGPGAVEQPADQRRRQSAGKRRQRIDRNHLRAVPAETLRDRFKEDRKTLAETAAEHRQRKTQRKHVERHAPGFGGFVGSFAAGVF